MVPMLWKNNLNIVMRCYLPKINSSPMAVKTPQVQDISYQYMSSSVSNRTTCKMSVRKISHSHPDFINIIYNLAHTCYLDLSEYVVEFGCEDVDSFLRGIYKVRLKGTRDGQKIKIQVVLKWHPDPKTRSCFREAYRREFVFYRHIMPKLLKIQRNFKNIEGLKMKFPNCVLASVEYDKETLAVQGLEEDGFKFRDRLHKTDLRHVCLVMKNLAKLHALSFALANTNPREFEEIWGLCSQDVQYSMPGPVPKSMKSLFDASVDVVLDASAREKLKKLGPHILTVLYNCVQIDTYSAICHADCWNNNILFKYQGDRPIEVIFIDYQLSRIASPVTDISYFLYMTADKELLSKHYDHILNIYYGTLTAVLRQCNLDVYEIYPPSIFRKHLEEYSVLGLIEALVSMKIITAEIVEALIMTEMKYERCDEEICVDELQDRSLFVQRVNDVVTDFFERNYSLDAVLYK